MAIIDLASWKPQSDEFVFAYRYPQTNLSTYTQLIVYESQVAFLFSKGKLMGKFGPGKHTLDTENLPILRSLFGIPFGGKNPFTAEIWIVNMLLPANLDWKINRMTIHDPDYNTQLPLTAFGQYGLKIINAEQFLINMVGTKNVFTESDMEDQAKGEFFTKVKTGVMQFMLKNNVGFKQISAYLDPISTYMKDFLGPFWDIYGLELTKFYVSSIDIDDSTPDGRKVKEALAQQTTMSITGHTWQQENAFGMANNAINKIGGALGGEGGGGLLGGLLAINMMNNMAGSGMGGNMMQPQYNQPTFGGTQGRSHDLGGSGVPMGGDTPKMIYCAKCSNKHSTTEKFCPHCGHAYNPCPKCGTDNLDSAKRCISCGTPLLAQSVGSNCPNCGTPVPDGAAFCGNCGTSLLSDKTSICPRCGTKLGFSTKFCPACGYKVIK